MRPLIYKHRPKIPRGAKLVDAYTSALKELFFVQHPGLKKSEPGTKKALDLFVKKADVPDCWIYYPETRVMVHTVDEKNYFTLRTARNRNLITPAEQKKFRELSAGIAGLSVGSCILSTLVVSGGPKNIKIADFDNLEITNLNRIRAKLTDIGKNKIQVAAREVWDLDPFARLKLFGRGLTQNNLKTFLLGKPVLDIFIDEMDSVDLKILARQLCKKHRIPVVMATDNGDSVVLDIERFDLEPNRQIFHGLLKKNDYNKIKASDYRQWLSLVTKIVGPEYLTSAMQNSLLEIGKTLPAVPQLGASAGVAGAAICLALRRIANRQKMPSGRYVISLEEKLLPEFSSPKQISLRKNQTKKFKQIFLT